MMWSSKIVIGWCAAVLCAGCVGKSDMYTEPSTDGDGGGNGGSSGVTFVSVQHLKTTYTGYPTPVTKEWEIRGTVTASDRYGSFPNTLVVQDATGGIEIKVGGKDIFLGFPVGRQIAVQCQGLVLGAYGQTVSLGVASENPDYQNSFIPVDVIPAHVRALDGFEPVLPDTLRIADLSPGMVSCFVAFEELQFIEQEHGLPWSDPGQDTDRHLIDRSGDTLVVRTSHKASFAGALLPSGSGYIEGILGYFNKHYQLRILNTKGVVMESDAFVPGTGRSINQTDAVR